MGAAEREKECSAWLAKNPTVDTQARKLEAALRRGEIWAGRACALQIVALVRNVVGSCKWNSAGELILRLKWLGRRLTKAAPRQKTVGNAVRRILWMIREDAAELSARSQGGRWQQRSLQDVLAAQDHDTVELEELPGDLKQSVMEQILEFYDEIDNVNEPITEQLVRHVGTSSQVVLTILDHADDDHGHIVAKACQHCAELLVVVSQDSSEIDPDASLHNSISKDSPLFKLSNLTLIPDTNIVAVMPRVDAVVLPARSVAGDGSLMAPPATFLVALAAKNYNRPVLAVTGLYKLSPGHPHNPFDAALHGTDPNQILPYANLPAEPTRDPDAIFQHTTSSPLSLSTLDVPNPLFDHVPASLLDLYITNTGAHQPSYVGRLLSDLYSPLDATL